jgi:hypothetical protein
MLHPSKYEISKLVRIAGLTPKDYAVIEREADRRGMRLMRFRGELIRKGLQALRSNHAEQGEK